ncbi:ISAs1 family transposase [Streptomyces nigra]|uniref:ISAs1 family transposase n=1 Tax=Streptomyces nigra TaxID=1827580 RepID=UPI003F517C40
MPICSDATPRAPGTWPWTARPPAARARTPALPPTCSPPSWKADAPSARTSGPPGPGPGQDHRGHRLHEAAGPFDLAGVVVTADALHTHRDHARWLVEAKKAHYLLVVKQNQPTLHDALRSLPWNEVTARRYDREAGHGRRETRSVRTLTVTSLGLDFPYLTQAAKIHRHRTDLRTGKITRETIYAITDLTAREASPQAIGQLARAQWGIEAVHHVRDTTFGEDASKIRTGHGPENMATLRSFAISTLRATGHRSIAAGLREVSYMPFTRPLDLIGLL